MFKVATSRDVQLKDVERSRRNKRALQINICNALRETAYRLAAAGPLYAYIYITLLLLAVKSRMPHVVGLLSVVSNSMTITEANEELILFFKLQVNGQ